MVLLGSSIVTGAVINGSLTTPTSSPDPASSLPEPPSLLGSACGGEAGSSLTGAGDGFEGEEEVPEVVGTEAAIE